MSPAFTSQVGRTLYTRLFRTGKMISDRQDFLPRAQMDVTNKNTGQGNVNEAQLDNLEGCGGSDGNGLIQGDPNGKVDVGSGFHNNWIGF